MAALVLPVQADDLPWQSALNGSNRSVENKARDNYRHPQQTLQFFGISAGMTVVEIAPGGGWYSEILAPLLQDNGRYYAAHYSANGPGGYYRKSLGGYLQKLGENPGAYKSVIVTTLQPPEEVTIAPAGSADLVVAFRNVHSWLRADSGDQTLSAIYTALKPGGTFGVVQHRAKAGVDIESMKKSGYVTERQMMDMAEAAGFVLAGSSQINANPKDTADYAEGVWTLPPSLRLKDKDREKYIAIGESDRMTLKFIKPQS
ncbi:MAG: class I SAM-dependent methyltransferase [Proteobacteria bacterium]|nr:class I SAM-dependent methyltransferase [Pseudomonadota bacterium]